MEPRTSLSPLEYYSQPTIAREVVDFLKDRWVAVHCQRRLRDGRLILIRYFRGKPLNIKSVGELRLVLKRLRRLAPRTFYGSANIYRRLDSREDALDYLGNVTNRTPTWDIDSRPEWWRATIEVGRAIVEILEREGVARSIWLKWSGRGLHVHVNEGAFSPEFLAKHNPLDASWAVVEYVIGKVQEKVVEVNLKYGTMIKVENLMDPQRVFTAPLSLHRELDVACVAFKPDSIDSFELDWTNPSSPRHEPDWRSYETGELDQIALKALRIVGVYDKPSARRTRLEAANAVQLIEKYAPPEAPRLEDLKFNPDPKPLSGRDLRYSPEKAVKYLEDILSSYILGRITLEEALAIIDAAREVTLKTQGYSRLEMEQLVDLYVAATRLLARLRSPEKVKEWLTHDGGH